jgi:hypothetical protein
MQHQYCHYLQVHAPPCAASASSSSISCLSFLTPLRLRVCSASATVTFSGWPLPYSHIQRLSSYSLQDKYNIQRLYTTIAASPCMNLQAAINCFSQVARVHFNSNITHTQEHLDAFTARIPFIVPSKYLCPCFQLEESRTRGAHEWLASRQFKLLFSTFSSSQAGGRASLNSEHVVTPRLRVST